jgi:tetratricopeptide (TPR) repeat protein
VRRTLALAALLAAVLVTYSNHFENGFEFDDFYTIVNNPAVRTLNVGRFFSDGSSLSIATTNQAYRPLLVTSLALDYRLAGGLKPFWFHVTAFFWYLVLLALLFCLCDSLFAGALAPALLATALFGLHPASAETVNYICQIADLYVALGVVAGVVLYARLPGLRRFGLYLIPPIGAILAKPTAAIFAPILTVYLLLFEWRGKRPLLRIALGVLPAYALTAVGLYVVSAMSSPTFAGAPAFFGHGYRITQPYVALRYFRTFFVPLFLSGDSDLKPLDSIWTLAALAGFAFLALMLAAAVWSSRHRSWRPVAFGLWWFLLGLIPTSVYPLSDLENDHRMFLPFIGLSIAVVGTARLLLPLSGAGKVRRYAAAAVSLLILAALAWGAHRRNEVWRTEESLWGDVVAKRPGSARAHLNYGFALTKVGKADQAWPVLLRAAAMDPRQFLAPVELAVAAAALGHPDDEIRAYFKWAIKLAPNEAMAYTDYAQWCRRRGQAAEAQDLYEHAAFLSPTDLTSRYALLEIYAGRKDWTRLSQTAYGLLDLVPGDVAAQKSLQLASSRLHRLESAERAADGQPTAANYTSLAAIYQEDDRYADAVRTAKRALELQPGFAEAQKVLRESQLAGGGQ